MGFKDRLKQAITWPLAILVIIWLVFILEQMTGSQWFIYGIAPRKTFAIDFALSSLEVEDASALLDDSSHAMIFD